MSGVLELVVAGQPVHIATGGKPFDPALPTIVFLHGAGMDHTVWTLQARYLSHHGYSVLAPDLPGHGRSSGPPRDTIAALSGWLVQLLDAGGVSSASLVGHSMGALIGLETAASAPDRVAKLALLGAAAEMPVHPDLLAAAEQGLGPAVDLVVAWGFGKRAHLGGAQAPGGWMLGAGRRVLERGLKVGAMAASFRACDAYKSALDSAAKVTAPVLLLLGETDRMTPPAGARPLAAKLKDSRTVVLPDTGHMMMIEAPDATLDALRAFL